MKTTYPSMLDYIYPVGSIYMSVNSADPATLFGGKWDRIKDHFLLAAGDTYSGGITGGSATHKHTTQAKALTTWQLPAAAIQSFQNTSGASKTLAAMGFSSQTVAASGWVGATGAEAKSKGVISQSTGQTHTHGDTGESSSLPPYLTVYMWQRTA